MSGKSVFAVDLGVLVKSAMLCLPRLRRIYTGDAKSGLLLRLSVACYSAAPLSRRLPGMARASAPFTRSVTTLSTSANNRKRLGQRFYRISVSDQSHGWHGSRAGRRHWTTCPGLI
jgi:hypothetical protein